MSRSLHLAGCRPALMMLKTALVRLDPLQDRADLYGRALATVYVLATCRLSHAECTCPSDYAQCNATSNEPL
jgi:hypothetical protein